MIKVLQRAASAVDRNLQDAFKNLGSAVTAKPWLVIVVTLVVAVALSGGMSMAKTESNGENLWTPQDTEAKDQQKWVLGTFGAANRQAYVYSMEGERNVLTREGLTALAQLTTKIKSTKASCEKGSCKGEQVHYGPGGGIDVSTGDAIMSVLSIWDDQQPPADADYLADINDQSKWISTSGTRLTEQDLFGGVDRDADGKIVSAKVFRTRFMLKNDLEDVDNEDKDPATEAWEMEFDKVVLDFSEIGLSDNFPYSQAGQASESGKAIQGDVSLLSIGYIMLIIYSGIVLSHAKLSKSNSVISMFSALSVAMAATSAFGICAYFGVKQNPVVSVLYLLLLGIGMDDTFVIVGALVRTDDGEPRERVITAVKRAGASITVTSVTNIVAFAAGMSSSLPALRDFCIFAATGIVFDFFYQCTFLIAIIYYRVKAAGPDWLFCMKVDPESTGYCSCSVPGCSRNGKHVCCPCTFESNGKDKTLMQSLLNRVTSLTLTPVGNVVVLAITSGLVFGACTGIPHLKQDFENEWFLPADSYAATSVQIVKDYFPTSGGIPFYVYTKAGDYSAAHRDGSLSAMYGRVRKCEWTARQVFNWYDSFVEEQSRSDRAQVSDKAFALEVSKFISSPAGSRFAKDVVFEKASGNVMGIMGTRAFYQGKLTEDAGQDIELVNKIRESTGKKPLDAFPFYYAFLFYDGFALMVEETIRNVVVALVCVLLVTTVLLGDILGSFLVVSMVGIVDVCLLGYMAHWNLDFNSVTAINVTIAVGLAVDYSAHVTHSFLVATGDHKQRVTHAIDHVGSSVANGAFTTFLAVLPLGASKSYVFTVFFKMWFMIIVFGIYMGLILLPVVLRWIGPPSYSTVEHETCHAGVKPMETATDEQLDVEHKGTAVGLEGGAAGA